MRFSLFSKNDNHELHLVMRAKAGDEEALHDLLIAHTPYIKKTASFICKRAIDEHDEEYSIAYQAFHEAVENYNPESSAKLTTFAHLIIKRRIIDHIRKEQRHTQHLTGEAANVEMADIAVSTFADYQLRMQRKEEISAYQLALFPFHLTFDELTKLAPKHEDSRKTIIEVAHIIADTPQFVEHLEAKHTLPLKQIEDLVDISRKTLERHRKYLIALVILLTGDYPALKTMVKGGRRE